MTTLMPAVEQDVTYELYRELAEELCVPVDHELSRDVKYELYKSKLIFLRNLYEQCFREVNARGKMKLATSETYTGEDLRLIHTAIEATNEFLRETLLEAVSEAMKVAGRRNPSNVMKVEEKAHAPIY